MRILKTKRFSKEAKAERLTDEALKKAIKEVQQGLIDAKLGGNLVKKRVAVGSKGKSGGLRTILVYRASANSIFCVYVFAKNEKDNIETKDLEALKLLGKALLSMTNKEIGIAIAKAELEEVIQDGDEDESNENSEEQEGD